MEKKQYNQPVLKIVPVRKNDIITDSPQQSPTQTYGFEPGSGLAPERSIFDEDEE